MNSTLEALIRILVHSNTIASASMNWRAKYEEENRFLFHFFFLLHTKYQTTDVRLRQHNYTEGFMAVKIYLIVYIKCNQMKKKRTNERMNERKIILNDFHSNRFWAQFHFKYIEISTKKYCKNFHVLNKIWFDFLSFIWQKTTVNALLKNFKWAK